jgi:hypothetical protein
MRKNRNFSRTFGENERSLPVGIDDSSFIPNEYWTYYRGVSVVVGCIFVVVRWCLFAVSNIFEVHAGPTGFSAGEMGWDGGCVIYGVIWDGRV